MSSRIHLNRASVSRTITTQLGASHAIDSLAAGLIGPGDYMPEDEGQYWQFRRYMHDILCLALIDKGAFKGHEFKIEKLGLTTNDRQINMQKPDLYTINHTEIHLGEVSLTYNVDVENKRKTQRYERLLEFLKQNGYNVRLDIIILDLTDPEWKESFGEMPGLFLNMLTDFIDCLRAIHSNPKFGNIRKVELGKYNTSRMQYVLEDDTITDQVFQATGVSMSPESINQKLSALGKDEMPDMDYIHSLAESIVYNRPHPRPTPDPRAIIPVTMKSEFEGIFSKPSTTNKLPKILQLGCPSWFQEKQQTFDEICDFFRTTGRSGGYVDHIKQSLYDKSPDEETRIIKLHLTNEQLEKEQMEGPGRKALLKRKGLKLPREQPKHIGVKPEHESMLVDLISQIGKEIRVGRLKELYPAEPRIAGLTIASEMEYINQRLETSPVSAILRFYQSFSNEIILNSMRRRKSGEYVLCHTGFVGLYFLVAPGPQLRTESNTEFIKVISFVPPMPTGFAADYIMVGDHWESKWLSVDVDRLKHWQRAFDRVSVSLLANAERLVRPGQSFRESFKEEVAFGNYTLLALTYLEDKQLTSVTNQTLRYLWMKSLGDKQFEGLASKFPERVNSIIQSTMLQRALRTCELLCGTRLTDLVKVHKLNRDDETGMYDETTTGIVNLLPRLFTFGSNVPISYNLNEIYWCMAYNKDRQNAAQDALHIMEKIVREEQKYNVEIGKREGDQKVDYFLGHTSLKEDIDHIHSPKPESHYYSSRAVRIGLQFQDNHSDNVADNGSWLNSEKLEKILSRPLSEYATFKASVKQIASYVNPNDLKEIDKIGVRTKAIELIAEILEKEELMTASDVVMHYSGEANKSFEILIQIFKKGQIGGVREIIILFIKARIMMNIVEEVARLLCKSDKREILTKGRDKRLMMRGDHEEVTSSFPDGTPIQVVKESYDMTVWCQKFIPIIFAQIHRYHFRDHPGMKALATHIFLAHSNKKIEYPKKLVEQWMLHKEVKHKSQAMQEIKEKFLKDGKPFLVNHSNMCQGIPHYNSSVLGLSCISLRDALFNSCLKILGVECALKWKTRLGSDDKGTIIGMNLSIPSHRLQLILFGQCERASERLHCMELSIKSASGHVMYELNSAYMANLETLSPTIKFSLASTDTIETTSCTTFVNESYSRIRQMRENGCTSVVCLYAHLQNAAHFDNIFGTGMGDVNDVSRILKISREKIPYDFGTYPLYDADLQDIVGPEFYNYRILKRFGNDNPAIKLLYTSLSKRDQEEMFLREDDDLMKKDHFGIQQGIVKQLANMRTRTNSIADDVEKFFEANPFLIIRGPETPFEALMMVRSKLFTKGAAQSLRRTSPAIYIGRLAAYRSAKAWILKRAYKAGYDIETQQDIMDTEVLRVTYSEYLRMGLEIVKDKVIDTKSLLPLLFPNNRSLDVVEQLVGKFGVTKSTDKKFSQAIRIWTVNNFNYEFTSSLRSILNTSFGTSQESTTEDVEEFRKMVGMRMSTLDGFVKECKDRGIRPLDMFFYLTKLHKNSRSTRIQTFGFGPSSSSLHMTATSLKRYNHMPGMTVIMDDGYEEETLTWANTMAAKLDKVKLYHNLVLMRETSRFTKMGSDDIDAQLNGVSFKEEVKTIIRGIRSISGFDFMTQKSTKLVAAFVLPESEFRDKLIEWKDLNYTYLKKQKKMVSRSGKITWSGDLSVLVSSGNECFTLNEVKGRRYVECKRIVDISELYRSIVSICRTLGIEVSTLFKRRPMFFGDIYLSDSQKRLFSSEARGAEGNVLNLRMNKAFQYKRVVDLLDFRIMKSYDPKSQVLTIHLEGTNGKTATVCHSRGTFYPVEIPAGLKFSEELEYQGVRFNSIIRNRDWFFNRQLPSMNERELIDFLKNDVNFAVVLSLETSDVNRITDYLEVREEVNEESFHLLQQHFDQAEEDSFEFDEATLYQKFEEAMNAEARDRTMEMFTGTIEDWAEDVEDEMSNLLAMTEEQQEGNVLVTKAFGYKKPKQRKAAHVVSSLMQGAEMRRRVLDSFFKLGSVKNEALRSLPGYIIWCNRMVNEGQLNEGLSDALIDHMVVALSQGTGARTRDLKQTILNQPRRVMETPLRSIFMIMTPEEETVTQDELMEDLFKLSDDYQEILSDNEDLYD